MTERRAGGLQTNRKSLLTRGEKTVCPLMREREREREINGETI